MQNKTDKIKQHKQTNDAKQTNKQTNKLQDRGQITNVEGCCICDICMCPCGCVHMYACICMCAMYVYTGTIATACMQKSEDNLRRWSSLSSCLRQGYLQTYGNSISISHLTMRTLELQTHGLLCPVLLEFWRSKHITH